MRKALILVVTALLLLAAAPSGPIDASGSQAATPSLILTSPPAVSGTAGSINPVDLPPCTSVPPGYIPAPFQAQPAILPSLVPPPVQFASPYPTAGADAPSVQGVVGAPLPSVPEPTPPLPLPPGLAVPEPAMSPPPNVGPEGVPMACIGSAASCSYPSYVPIPSSDCQFESSTDVLPGGSIVLEVASTTTSLFAITAASADQDCSGSSTPPQSGSSLIFTLTCPTGLPAGSTISLTLGLGQHYPFVATLTVTYNAGGSQPTTDTVALASPPPVGPIVSYPAGWSLVAGPTGTMLTGAAGPLYTYQAGDTSYEVLPTDTPLQAGTGYWAYFPEATSITLPSVNPQDLTIPLPAGEWIMVGNPFDFLMVPQPAPGTDLTAETYDPSSGNYQPVPPAPCCVVRPGAGAWVFSSTGGSVTISLGAGPP